MDMNTGEVESFSVNGIAHSTKDLCGSNLGGW